ncbi:AAA family ATPase [Catellatospora coxensis]
MADFPTVTSAFQEPPGNLLPVIPAEVYRTRRVVLFGPPGIGKTTAAGVLGQQLKLPVVRLAPGPQDSRIPHAALLELALALQPQPGAQKLAAGLDDAAEPGSVDHTKTALRLRRLTAALLRDTPPLTLLVDNAQWLDPASAAILRWALRMAPNLPVIAAERTWHPGAAGHWCGEDPCTVRIPAMTAEQIAALLSPYRLSANQVTQAHTRSGGNPALALALAGAHDRTANMSATRGPEGDPLLPSAARRLVGEWLGTVSADVQHLLTFAALDDQPDLVLLSRLAGPAAESLLAEAEAAGLIDIGQPDGKIRFTAAAIGAELAARPPAAARRLLHTRLAEASHDSVRRDRHTTLAADTTDPQSAYHAARAAARARLRGQHALAAELSLLAAERTPHADTDLLTERALTAVRDAAHCGDLLRGQIAVRLVLHHDSSPAQRVNALITLIDSGGQHLHSADELFADALHEAADQPDLTAQILIRQAIWANVNEGNPGRACALAAQAASLARTAGDTATTAMALTMQARVQRILGHPEAETTLRHALSLPRSTHPRQRHTRTAQCPPRPLRRSPGRSPQRPAATACRSGAVGRRRGHRRHPAQPRRSRDPRRTMRTCPELRRPSPVADRRGWPGPRTGVLHLRTRRRHRLAHRLRPRARTPRGRHRPPGGQQGLPLPEPLRPRTPSAGHRPSERSPASAGGGPDT